MKRILSTIFIFFFAVCMAQNKEVEKIIPPLEVIKQFEKAFPKIEPHWDKTYRGEDLTELNYDANFAIGGKNMTAVYTVFGVFKVLECELSQDEIPSNIRQYLSKNYPENKIVRSLKIMNNNNKVTYEIGIKINDRLSDALFDAQGDFLSIVEK
ncbi:hypothetical protein [Flavobacterium sp.]|uniref:hypothetical protein n=1 Tax=Flavobacterium sp. TaxID=239 RepID=UPI002610B079|nr:hypothetical protein [Flavobacterium sp.]